jgi:hypothetical protein
VLFIHHKPVTVFEPIDYLKALENQGS